MISSSNCVLIHYGEIGLKGKNRGDFENQLAANIKTATGEDNVTKTPGRIVLFPKNANNEQLREKLSTVPGIAWFAFASTCASEIPAIEAAVENAAKEKLENKNCTFKIDARRSFEGFPLSSNQLNNLLGDEVRKRFNARVSLSNPDVTLYVEVARKECFVFTEKIQGPGGLPVGTAGKVLCLLSGGIDSPVSGWLMAKRGCAVDFLHVHALRSNSEVNNSKVRVVYSNALRYSPTSKLYTVGFHEFDLAVQQIPSKFHLVMFKRFLLLLAQGLASKISAEAIVTGDSLAQVASQTLQSISAIDKMELPVFRPLIGLDKLEIIKIARNIGTYEASICGYKDCCALISQSPATKPKRSDVEKLEKEMQLEKIVQKTLENMELL